MKFTVVSGAPCGLDDLEYLKNNADRNSKVIAADHGYETCKSAGIMPDIIVGDFDSASYPDYNCELIKLPHEKDNTDTFYCVKEAIKRGADAIEIYCALGGRMDHSLSNIIALKYCLDSGVDAVIKDRHNEISMHDKAFYIPKSEKHKYYSVFAFGAPVTGLVQKGAEYELCGVTLSPYDNFSISNEVAADKAFVDFKSGIIMLVLSND